MLSKPFFKKLRTDYQKRETERHAIIAAANAVLHDAKRVIFAVHRGDLDKAGQALATIERTLAQLEKKFTFPRLIQEGAFSAALEEYAEAKFFHATVTGKNIQAVTETKLTLDSYLGGLCDTTGELVRYATNRAAAGDTAATQRAAALLEAIMNELVDFDLTGYLRTKYDQAKGNLRKMEQIIYDLSLRGRDK